MSKTLVITILATDRPGIVHSISGILMTHQANWIDSRMSNLADKFAGLVKVSVPDNQLQALQASLQALHDADNQLHLLMEEAGKKEACDQEANASHTPLSLELVGTDHPGIIDDITGALANLGVNIRELASGFKEAAMSHETLFWARLTLGLPKGVSTDSVQDALEALSDQLMVDIVISD